MFGSGGRLNFRIPGFGNINLSDRAVGFRGQGFSGRLPLGGGRGWGREYEVVEYDGYDRFGRGQGELIGPYPNPAMAQAYGRAAGAEPWMRTARREMYGEGVVMGDPRGQALPPRGHGHLPPPPLDAPDRFNPRTGQWEQRAPHAPAAPMDIRPHAQAAPAAPAQRQPQAATPALREPSAEVLQTIRQALGGRNRAEILALQTNLEQMGFGARTDASKYSKVDGIAGPLTARGFAHYAQSRGLDPNNVQATLNALRQESAQQQGQIRGGQPMQHSEAVQPNMWARNAEAAMRMQTDRDRGA